MDKNIKAIEKLWNETGSVLGSQTPNLIEIGEIIWNVKNTQTKDKATNEQVWKSFVSNVKTVLGFSEGVMKKFIDFAQDEFIKEHAEQLPPRYNTLYDLRASTLSKRCFDEKEVDNEKITQLWERMLNGNDFRITPNTTQAELKEFCEKVAEENGVVTTTQHELVEVKQIPVAELDEMNASDLVVRLSMVDEANVETIVKGIQRVVSVYNRKKGVAEAAKADIQKAA